METQALELNNLTQCLSCVYCKGTGMDEASRDVVVKCGLPRGERYSADISRLGDECYYKKETSYVRQMDTN